MTPVETAVRTYISAAFERDPAKRLELVEASFAASGRFITRSSTLHGPAAIDAMLARFQADPKVRSIRMTSAIDAVNTTFRYRSIVDFTDDTSTEFYDTGEIDADGKIVTLFAFSGPI